MIIKLLTIDEMRTPGGFARSTVYKNLHFGRYPFKPIKCGNKLRFRASDIEKWYEDGCPYLPVKSHSA